MGARGMSRAADYSNGCRGSHRVARIHRVRSEMTIRRLDVSGMGDSDVVAERIAVAGGTHGDDLTVSNGVDGHTTG